MNELTNTTEPQIAYSECCTQLIISECSLKAKEGDWCIHYREKCFLNCEYASKYNLSKYEKAEN
jgi:hypothetical protein